MNVFGTVFTKWNVKSCNPVQHGPKEKQKHVRAFSLLYIQYKHLVQELKQV